MAQSLNISITNIISKDWSWQHSPMYNRHN